MKLAKWAILGLALMATPGAPGPAGADDVHERIFEISPVAGMFFSDDNANYDAASPLAGLRLTMNNSARWGLEGMFAISPGQTRTTRQGMLESYDFQVVYDTSQQPTGFVITDIQTTESTEETDSTLLMYGGSVFYHFSEQRLRPYVNVGAGFLDDIGNSNQDPPGAFSDPFWDVGFGIKYFRPNGLCLRFGISDLVMRKDNLAREDPRAAIVAAQRDIVTGGGADGALFTEPYDPTDYEGKRWLNNYAASLTVSFPFGWVWKDADGDEVADRFDRCPTTAPGVVVDGVGCGIDSDSDGVFDGIDQCDATPIGATVSIEGCPSDADGDGVFDGIDVANDTPAGALVDAEGRHYDTDGDGIFDGLDLCNDTPQGAGIDETGCADDPVEERLLRGELIVVQEIEFEPGTDEIEPLSFHHVNKIARLVEQWTGNEDQPLRIEIGVHTDGIGAAETNQALSQERAEALRVYLLENYFGTGANNLLSRGYGESLPIANDMTPEGRATNRRLEIRMTGPGNAPEEWDFGAGDEDGGDDLFDDDGEFDIDSIGGDLGDFEDDEAADGEDDDFDLDSLFGDDEFGDDEEIEEEPTENVGEEAPGDE